MITVKSTKGPVESGDPAAQYVQKPAERKGGLVKAGAWLIAVAVYLKAALSGKVAETSPETESPSEDPVDAPNLSVIPGGKPQPSTGREPAEGDPGFLASDVTFALGTQSDTIAFPSVAQKTISPVFQPAAFVRSEANENASPGGGAVPHGQGGAPAGPGRTGRLIDPPASSPKTTPDAPVSERPDDSPGPDASPGEGDVDDGEGGDDTKSANRAPRVTGPVRLNDISGCGVLAIGLAELLRGASDPDGDALHVGDLTASSGGLTQRSDGSWEFAPEGEMGPVTISYRISDGSLTVDQTLHFAVTPTQDVVGTDGNDILVGTMCADRIDAGAGDDLVDARAGNDVILGGAGNDHIVAGAGDDWVRGGAGDDVIFGGSGDDVLEGGAGNDRLFGEAGDDELWGGDGQDDLRGGEGNDLLFGDAGDDILHGGAGDDKLEGGAGNDHVDGGTGNDLISGGEGKDRLLGGSGDDLLFGNGGNDLIEAGEGDDLALGGAGDDTLDGAGGDDRLSGGDGDDRLDGGEGNDIVLGEAGDDVLDGGLGEDMVLGGEGDDRIVGAADGAKDHYDGEDGCDTLDYSATSEDLVVDLVAGCATGVEIGEDTITGFERITTGAGDDLIRFGGNPVSMSGGEGRNAFEFKAPAQPTDAADAPIRQVKFEIDDFKVGDQLRLSKWDIYDEVFDELEDDFERLYGDRSDDDHVPIRYRSEMSEEMSETIIEADLDGDDFYEVAIFFNGRHALVFHETV